MHSPQETQDESAHGQVVIEGDSGLIALAAPRQYPVMPNVVAAANTAVAENASFVIDRNGDRGIVVSSWRTAPSESVVARFAPAASRSSSQSPECC